MVIFGHSVNHTHAYMWKLFYTIDSKLFQVTFGEDFWKNKANHKNLQLPARYGDTIAYKIYAVLCLNRSV